MPDPIRAELRQPMNEIGLLLEEAFNEKGKLKKYGFALLVFDFVKPGEERQYMNWISNAQRPDMITAMKEFIARNEGRMLDEEGHA
jgi:hypothetical protein